MTDKTRTFINKANIIHNNKYDYSKTDYINYNEKVCIICHEHGDFYQTPNAHLYRKQGCKKCSDIKNSKNKTKSKEYFIKEVKLIHGNKYNYFKVNYINSKEKVCIICLEHGEFYQTPNHHLQGEGCPKCKNKKLSLINIRRCDDLISISNNVHNNKYDYSKVNYISCKEKVCIICPIHGEFYQTPDAHIRKQGCPICNESKLEKETAVFLDENDIIYERQKRFNWLGKQSLDFYLPDYNIGIECQGEQHYAPTLFNNSSNLDPAIELEKRKVLDKEKYDICHENGFIIIYFTMTEYFHNKNVNIYQPFYSDKIVFTKMEKLIYYILNHDK